jgi:putative ABC transport system substrate-binding protein
MKRREFIAGLGGAMAWPLAVRAQQRDRVRRVGALIGWSQNDPGFQSFVDAFVAGLSQFGWRDGVNARIEQKWTGAKADRTQPLAQELVELQPDVILAVTTPVTAALIRETSKIPIVFVVVSDPIGAGFVASLPRPGGGVTGFINIEGGMGGKWFELLKEIAPHIKRAAIMFNPDTAPGRGKFFLPSFEAAARSAAIESITMEVRSDTEIEAAISNLGRQQAGLVAMTDSFLAVHRGIIISSTARNNVPMITDWEAFVRDGGLMSYGPNYPDMFRRAAGHVDRILRGTKPAELPVEVPTKWDFFINGRTAEALGLIIPETLLATADGVMQ